MVDGVESFFQIDENHTIYKAILSILTDQLLVASNNAVVYCAMIGIQIGSELVSCYH